MTARQIRVVFEADEFDPLKAACRAELLKIASTP
jgi:hypothetical protein